LPAYEKFAAAAMTTPPFELNQALIAYHHDLLGEATRTCRAILSREPAHVAALHLLGLMHLKQGQPAQAVDCLRQAAALQSQTAALHAHLGEAYRALGQLDRAETCFRAAVRLPPDSGEFLDVLGWTLPGQRKVEHPAVTR
jgi:Tfp pilus assembly protein PilF